jgi:hypothetical protein
VAAQGRYATMVRLATEVRRAGRNDGGIRAGVDAVTKEAHPAEDERTKIQSFHTSDFAERRGCGRSMNVSVVEDADLSSTTRLLNNSVRTPPRGAPEPCDLTGIECATRDPV